MHHYGSCSTLPGMTREERTREPDKVPLNIAVPQELKARLERYAADAGLSQAAASRILLDKSLADAGYRRAR